MKCSITCTLALLALSACGQPAGDPSHEILATSKLTIGAIVELQTSPSLKSGSLADAAREWQNAGWHGVDPSACMGKMKTAGGPVSAYEYRVIGYEPDKIPTYNLRICAVQENSPKRVAAIGYVVSSEAATVVKP